MFYLFFFFKQKTAYEMRISDWSSDVCSSDLEKFSGKRWTIPAKVYARPLELFVGRKLSRDDFLTELDALGYRRESVANGPGAASVNEIGRASCRERVCEYV